MTDDQQIKEGLKCYNYHVYIAGPYAGSNRWEQECNVRLMEQTALAIAAMRLVPVCPHTMYRNFDGLGVVQFWHDVAMSLLKRCDCIFMSRDWAKSDSANMERMYCLVNDIPVIYDLEQLKKWVETCEDKKMLYNPGSTYISRHRNVYWIEYKVDEEWLLFDLSVFWSFDLAVQRLEVAKRTCPRNEVRLVEGIARPTYNCPTNGDNTSKSSA